MFSLKAKVENFLERVPLVSKYLPDTILYYASKLCPQHLPKRMLEYRDKYEHDLVLNMSDGGIAEAQKYLTEVWAAEHDSDFFECTPEEGKKAYLHRFAAAGAATSAAEAAPATAPEASSAASMMTLATEAPNCAP